MKQAGAAPAPGERIGVSNKKLTACLWGLLLVAACGSVFAPVSGHSFVSWDDPQYVLNNPHVAAGLTRSSITWALTASGGYYWHPLTWLSHMTDVQLYGLSPGAHHVSNLLLHTLASLLLFGALWRLTGAAGASGMVAALFAVHPLHVESVAWVAERKDVLSGVCWMATLLAYARFVNQPRAGRFLLVIGLFTLGLMAKPMVLTLPLVLLLLDFWPLQRLPSGRPRVLRGLVIEKLPLFGLSILSAVVTLIGQSAGGAVRSLDAVPLWLRAGNAIASISAYLRQTFWPVGLAAYYPYPRALPVGRVAVAAVIVGVLSAFAWRLRARRPHLLVGWSWFLVTLVPVIGLVQVGDQAMADRFTYLPLVGIFIAVAFEFKQAIGAARLNPTLVGVVATCIVVAFGATARHQVGFWKDSTTLWTRAASVTADNERAHANLGLLLEKQGRTRDAIAHYLEAARILRLDAAAVGVSPGGAAMMHNQAGLLYMSEGLVPEAVDQFSSAVDQCPRDPAYVHNLAVALDEQGRHGDALGHHMAAARLQPSDPESRSSACLALARRGRPAEAIPECLAAIRLSPGRAAWHYNVALILLDVGDVNEAVAHLEKAVSLDAGLEEARLELTRLSAARPQNVRSRPDLR